MNQDPTPGAEPNVPNVYHAPSGVHGHGVFARTALTPGETAEVCPVLVVAADHVEAFNTTGLDHYCYAWGDGAVAIALGCGSLYNHSFRPNASFSIDEHAGTITITALTRIERDEEIVFNYLGDSTDPDGLWFELST